MNTRSRALTFGAALTLCVALAGRSIADEPVTFASSTIEYLGARDAEPVGMQMVVDGRAVEMLPPSTIPPVPGESHALSEMRSMGEEQVAPLLDDGNICDPMIGEEIGSYYEGGVRRGVRPYGGGHPWDWAWGCGGSPFRNGPGMCDTYRVGPIWNVAVDGMVMKREGTNLAQIWDETDDGQGIPELFEQFDWSSGGRLSVIGKHPACAGYQVQAGIEGIEKWEAVVVYPKETLDPDIAFTSQRRVHYTTDLYSGELNILRTCDPVWQPFCGVRYFQLGDRLQIADNQEAQGPLPIQLFPPDVVTTTDMTNIFNLKNQLMGFQIGLRHDFWRPNSRFAIAGFINGGVYYNKIKYSNFMNTTTTQRIGDTTGDLTEDPTTGRSDTVSSTNLDASDLSEIAYSYEASLSGVCRLNKCWSMRAGYQILWINGLRLADRSFLDPDIFLDNGTNSLLFQGWHAGIECRR